MGMAEYIKRMDTFSDEMCEGIDCGVCPFYNKAGENDCQVVAFLRSIPAADVRPVPDGGIGEMSDGYHTFNGLYYQRMVLFAALVKAHKDKAWKSWKHEDEEPCFGGGWFIVGIDTLQGSYTYHYDKMYWNLFECEELPTAKRWDGHTEKDVTRLLSLDVQPVVRGKWRLYSPLTDTYECDKCGYQVIDESFRTNFCPNCGARMVNDDV